MIKFLHKFQYWKSGKGENFNIVEVFKKIKNLKPLEIHVGSDSQVIKQDVAYVSAICLTWPGKGGIYFIHKNVIPHKTKLNLQSRLLEEVQRSLEIAEQLKSHTEKKIIVHIDANQQAIHKSAKYAKMLKNYVLAMGYQYLLKPDSWASGSVADRYTK